MTTAKPPARRGTTNRNERGNTRDREARRAYLLRVYESDEGTGTCRCYRCGKLLWDYTVTVDRIIPGARGGGYRRNNIRPACSTCNSATGAKARKP
jgi:5-methylcytosine-specific restriction endonuclease McrA